MRAIWAAIFLIASTALALAGGRVALVIGNNAYNNLTPLANPRLDAETLASMLADNGFDVLSCDGNKPGCFDLDRGDFTDTLEMFARKSRGADMALVFYAGHGMQTAKGNVLAPVDMEIDCGADDPFRAVMLDQVLDAVSGATEKIIILDACRNDPLQARQCAQRGAKPLSFGSFAVSQGETKFLLMASTLPGQTAPDGLPGGHSPFAEALFHWIKEAPGIEISQLLDHVAIRVEERARAQSFIQVPEILIRGGAPKSCLQASGCSADPEASALRKEVDELRKSNARASEYEEIVVAMLHEAGYDSLDALPADQRKRFFDGIVGASRALAARDDAKGEEALAALKQGDEKQAAKLFEDELENSREHKAEEGGAEAARHLAALAVAKDSAKAADFYRQAAELAGSNIDYWMDYGAAAETAGDSAGALRAFREASRLARDTGSVSQRVWAAFREGDIVNVQGRPERALKLYQLAADLAAQRAEDNPDDLDARRDVSVGLERIGDVLVTQNNLTRAADNFRQCLALRRDLAAADPGNESAQADIMFALNRIGDVERGQNDLGAAATAYGESLQIARRLAAGDPTNEARARYVMVALNRLGDIKRLRNDLDGALADFEEARTIVARQVAADPNNAIAAADMITSLDFVSTVMRSRGETEAAMANYREALAIARRLAAADPASMERQRAVSVALNKVGDLQIAAGDHDGALVSYREGLDIARRAAAADATHSERARDLTISLERVGDALERAGDLAGALDAQEEALAIRRRLAAEDPTNAERSRDVSVSLNKVGTIRLAKGDADGAIAVFREGLVLVEALKAADPSHAEWRRDVMYSHFKLADAGDNARAEYEAALAEVEEMRALGMLEPADDWLTGFFRDRIAALPPQQ